jgi:protein TonB
VSGRRGGGLKRAISISAVVHLLVIAAVWAVTSRAPTIPPMRVYAVNIVSPPPREQGETQPEVPPAAEEPEPEPEPEVEEPEPEPVRAPPPPAPPPAPTPRPAPPPPPAPPRQTEPARPEREPAAQPEQPRPSTGAQPDPSSAGGENLNLQLRGVQCPSPDYCNNIILQITRYFRFSGRGEADVYFVINRDGSITDLRLISSTGGAGFRVAVMEAVEQAGNNDAFGPLPDAYRADRLPVSFYFRPSQ